MKRKFLSAVLVLVLLIGAAVPAYGEETEEQEPENVFSETIFINSLEDFLNLADNCVLDTWSLDKKVVLQADISLGGVDFPCIATFGGTLEGNGHTISGLEISESVAPAGLIRYMQPTAVVRNLNVTGHVTPDGDAVTAGGLVGENHGTLEHCSFRGDVVGKTDTGGIAGANYGLIRSCKTEGKLTGEYRTGGIAGYNEGTIDGCENAMEINVDSVDPTIDPTQIDLDFNMDMSRLSGMDTSDAAKDTGGIAGYCAGIVRNCANTGKIGYPHIGYNLGGIVGRNCGLVIDCRNEGQIQGRKDVGGIAGQIEPNIATILSPDYLETLSKQFENLGGLTDAAGRHAAGSGDQAQSCVQRIVAYENSARAALDDLLSELAGSIESGDYGFSFDSGSIQALRNAIQGMANATNDLQKVIAGSVEDLSDDVSAISGQIHSISETFALATEDAKKETVTDISDVDLGDISDGKLLRCTNKGTVEGDLNIGGIVGVMGMEYEVDPEDDAPSGNITQRRRYELKAIVQDCTNTGTVSGKRSYVGGVCGRMELGLIWASQGYGTIRSESGGYVGGIAGLAGGTVRGCFAKCSLSGTNYIGGIVGCGIAEDVGGGSSTVADCYAMVDIENAGQYTGAISGADIGTYTGNYFVSDTLAGINGVSYSALAEPISYDALWRVQGLPDALRKFTLSFVADEETVKEVPFDYGDSFDASVYPEIPQKDGYYAQWSTDDLEDLRFDTVVQVEYYPYITALNSGAIRSDGRSMLFVQGSFKSRDAIQVTPGTVSFPETESRHLLERWHISIPADGSESHHIRYLPAEEEVTIYLLENGNWNKLSPETMGSYLDFQASGSEVDIAIVADSGSRILWYIVPAAILTVLLLLLLIVWMKKRAKKRRREEVTSPAQPEAKKPRKKRRWLLLLAALLLIGLIAAVGLYCCFSGTKAGETMQACDILKTYLSQPEQEMQLTVEAQIDDKDANFTAQISRTQIGDTAVSVISESGRRLYFADDVVFLENGDAYRLNGAAPDYAGLLTWVLKAYSLADIDSADGIYTITVEDAQAAAILKLLLPSVEALLPENNRLTIHLITEEGCLSQISFTGAGNLTDSVKTPFSLSATVDILPVSGEPAIPEAVQQRILSGDAHPQEVYSDELIKLMDAWSHMRAQDPLTAQIALEADCGPLAVSDTFTYYQWRADGSIIQGIEKDGQMVFLGSNGACDREGRKADGPVDVDANELLDIAYRNFSRADFQFKQEDSASIYLVSLDQEGMEKITGSLLPQTKDKTIAFEKGSIRLVVEDGKFQSIAFSCTGSSKVLTETVDYRLKADMTFMDGNSQQELPQKVIDALVK